MVMWYKIQNDKVILRIFAKPNARNSSLLKIDSNGMHIALHAKPHEGEANKELILFLSQLFKIAKSHIIFLRGENSKHKELIIPLTAATQKLLDNPDLLIKK